MNQIMTSQNSNNWQNSDWYKEWIKLAIQDYHGNHVGYWICYNNSENDLIYEYIDM